MNKKQLHIKKFGFVSDAAEDEYKALPADIKHEFGINLRALQNNRKPFMLVKPLSSIGTGVMELIINGSPAWRCIYIVKYLDAVIVLHSFSKTTNGTDRPAMKLATQRYKKLMDIVRDNKKTEKNAAKQQPKPG
ncbi:hypothetical protein MNBD_GAMMA10-879 [hydrothermal vent metagenome]|uniref:Phage-related protein n=1 Tax=hydrothermal vent metagenome TaxID=652676 RepID=A0A3B0XIP3_9ZZZZ